jgi:protoporphyrinogen oxidase
MILIIGAGVSGLTVASNLVPGSEFIILEKESYIGGLSTRYFSDGYWFDFGGHYFHFQDKPEIKSYLEGFCRFREFSRRSKTFLLGRYIPFPVQFHLSYLPASLRNGILGEILSGIDKHKSSSFSLESLHDFLEAHFGPTLFRLFFQPFLTRYYKTDLKRLAADMDRGSIPVPDKDQVVAGFKGRASFGAGYNPVIFYPGSSLGDFIKKYAAPVRDCIRCNEEVIEIDAVRRVARTVKGVYYYDTLVTSMPLNRLLKIIKPRDRFPSYRQLGYVSTILTNVILRGKRKRFHWVYLAEKKFPFYRMGFYAVHPYPACYLERNVIPGSPVEMNKERIIPEVVFTLKELQVIKSRDEIVYLDVRCIPVSYVLFDREWGRTVPPLLEGLKKHNIYSIGRYGTWNYSYMSNDIQGARECARVICE